MPHEAEALDGIAGLDLLYESLPLAPNSSTIRLLDLKNGNTEDPLVGTLRVVSLTENPEFAALSYVWGPWSSPKDRISCNGCPLGITANCHAALHTLRKSLGSLTIWIDSICINQKDEKERAQQILLLGDIYTHAQPTYIWLGCGSELTDIAMTGIKFMAQLRLIPVGIPWINGKMEMSPRQDILEMLKRIFKLCLRAYYGTAKPIRSLSIDPPVLSDFCVLLETDWLSRAWTFQEIILASNPIIVCGVQFCDWATFYQGLDFLYDPTKAFYMWAMLSGSRFIDRQRLPQQTFAPWQDLIYLHENVARPISLNDHIKRRLPEDQAWSVAKYHDQYISKWLWPWMVVGNIVAITPVGLALAANVTAIWFTMKRDNLKVLVAFEFLPLFLLIVYGPVLLYFNLHMHLRSDKGRVSLSGRGAGTLERHIEDHLNKNQALYRYYHTDSMASANYAAVVRLGRVLRERQASDPKDKSFAIHGILQRVGIPQPEPDYRKSLGAIYYELYEQILEHHPRMVNLLIDAGSGSFDGPSWVPDWSTIQERAFLPVSYLVDPIKDHTNDQLPLVKIHGEALEVRVVWRGTIAYSSPPLSRLMGYYQARHDDDDDDDSIAIDCALMHLLHDWLDYLSSRQSLKAIWTSVYGILVAHEIPFGQNRPEFSGDFHDLARYWYSETIRTFFGSSHSSDDVAITTSIQRFVRGSEYMQCFLKLCSDNLGRKRGLFVSTRGGIGSGPPGTEVGDRVANIVGVAAPLILRKVEDRLGGYRVIGPAFVEDFMVWSWERRPQVLVEPVPPLPDGRAIPPRVTVVNPSPIPEERYRHNANEYYIRIYLV